MMKNKIQRQKSGITFEFGYVLNHEALYAKMQAYTFPVGFIWYEQTLNDVINIGMVFVPDIFRRRGIATELLMFLHDSFPECKIMTARGNDLSTPWLIKNGFVYDDIGWVAEPKIAKAR